MSVLARLHDLPTRRRLVGLVTVAAVAAGVQVASATGVGVPTSRDMDLAWTQPIAGASSIEFFERRDEGATVRRYAAVGVMGYGVEFVDVTVPDRALVVGRYLTPGVSYHTDVRINVDRDILVLNVDSPGATAAQGVGPGIEFVDISDLAAPARLGVVPGLEGPHKLALVGDNHVYTTLPTYVIDYTDPRSPENLGRPFQVCGHAFTVDANDPTIAYAGSCSRFKWQVLDVSDAAKPRVVSDNVDFGIDTPHEAIPAPDSSFVAVSDLRNDYTQTTCPGGGIHFFDISGRYTEPDDDGPASRTNPIKMGQWFPPFTGTAPGTGSTGTWGSCTAHGVTMAPERFLLSDAHYMAGGWLLDPRSDGTSGGAYTEYSAEPGPGLGPTTWGTTLANWTLPGNLLWYMEWAPFDDPVYDRFLFAVSPDRGLDVVEHTGELPKKSARLDARRSGDLVTGRLARHPVLTHEGWVSKPLAGQAVTLTAGGLSTTVTTADDGSWSAPPPASGPVTVQWAGDDTFETIRATLGS